MSMNGLKAIEPVGAARPNGSKPSASDTRSSATTSAASEIGVGQAVAQLQQHLNMLTQSSQFSVDYLSGLDVVTVRDTSTGEIIRQVPSTEAVRLAQLLRRGDMSGPTAFLDTKV